MSGWAGAVMWLGRGRDVKKSPFQPISRIFAFPILLPSDPLIESLGKRLKSLIRRIVCESLSDFFPTESSLQ